MHMYVFCSSFFLNLKSSEYLLLDGSDHCDSSTKLADSSDVGDDQFIESISTKATAPVSLLVESLVQQLCTMIDSDPNRSKRLYSVICNQLHRMNLIDETYLMGEFDVMRSQYQRALYQLATITNGPSKSLPSNVGDPWTSNDSIGSSWSRYQREFDELNFIAGGGFGRVYRARHKLDGIIYAVKKITIKYQTVERILTHLAEVKTFASLNHTNIVPYKAAWIEPLFDNEPKRINSNVKSDKNIKKHADIVLLPDGKLYDVTSQQTNTNQYEQTESGTSSDDEVAMSMVNDRNGLLKPNDNYIDESSDFIEFQKSKSEDAVDGVLELRQISNRSKRRKNLQRNRAICKQNKLKTELKFDAKNINDGTKQKWAILYIQMTYRPLTLRAWLNNRNRYKHFNEFYKKFVVKYISQIDHNDKQDNENDLISDDNCPVMITSGPALDECLAKEWHSNEITMDIFLQVLNALNYIHLQSIVHHDVKPSNIFIGCEKNGHLFVQLGDFGLACPRKSKHTPNNMIGTMTYAAPEQLRGQCNQKVGNFE